MSHWASGGYALGNHAAQLCQTSAKRRRLIESNHLGITYDLLLFYWVLEFFVISN